MTNNTDNLPVKKQSHSYTINCHGKLIDLSTPNVMGILNITDNSFFDGGKFIEESNMLLQVEKMLNEGAKIIDIGAASSKPGSSILAEDIEIERIKNSINKILKIFPSIIISVDTWRSSVAEIAINEGAAIINDISGTDMDPNMIKVLSKYNIPFIMMHMQGTPLTMQQNPTYENVVIEVIKKLQAKIYQLKNLGINDIIIDPGFGFGKSIDHNYSLLKNLSLFKILDCPILVGVSRKSMINAVLNIKAKEALNGTTILNTLALLNGASIIRVHDVKEANEAVKLVFHYQQST